MSQPVRLPAVAGRFYPGAAVELASLVDTLLAGVAVPDEGLAEAYVVPHAGYRFSGLTAAQVYARLRTHAGRVSRVVLVGPAHHVRLVGCAVPSTAVWLTPLGDQPIDVDAARALAVDGHATTDDTPHAPEHSLEVQVPFLQRVLPGVPVLPLLIGRSTVDDVAVTVAAAVGERPGTVVLCSTDLSHYLDQAAARRQDDNTARSIVDLAPERIGVRDACGVFALRGTLAWARHRGLRATLLHVCTSADTVGDPARVVGYGAFAFGAG